MITVIIRKTRTIFVKTQLCFCLKKKKENKTNFKVQEYLDEDHDIGD